MHITPVSLDLQSRVQTSAAACCVVLCFLSLLSLCHWCWPQISHDVVQIQADQSATTHCRPCLCEATKSREQDQQFWQQLLSSQVCHACLPPSQTHPSTSILSFVRARTLTIAPSSTQFTTATTTFTHSTRDVSQFNRLPVLVSHWAKKIHFAWLGILVRM